MTPDSRHQNLNSKQSGACTRSPIRIIRKDGSTGISAIGKLVTPAGQMSRGCACSTHTTTRPTSNCVLTSIGTGSSLATGMPAGCPSHASARAYLSTSAQRDCTNATLHSPCLRHHWRRYAADVIDIGRRSERSASMASLLKK